MSDGSLASITIKDTAGQERYSAITSNYYKNADCCLLVYDISQRDSFDALKIYFQMIKDYWKKNIQIILLGNKTDLEDERQIKSEEGAKLAKDNGYIFLETSCLKNSNVANAFETLIEITNIETKKNKSQNQNSEKSNNVNLSSKKQTNPQKSSGCC